MKTCKRCKIEKELSEFYVHKEMGDGHLSFCKSCTKKRIWKYVENNADILSERERNRYQKRRQDPLFLLKRKEYQDARRTPELTRASNVCNRNLKHMKPEICEKCKERKAKQGHHPDYSKPFEVQWLCVRCHIRTHKALERTE